MGFAESIQAFAVAEVAAFALAVARMAGVVLVAPFPGQGVPNRVKVGLVLLLAFLARSTVATPFSGQLDVRLLALSIAEVGTGLLMGFTVRITFSAGEILGASVAQSSGLTMAQVYDPNLGSEDPVAARVVTLFATLLFLSLGAHRVLLGYALESFRAVPIGQAVDLAGATPSLVAWVGQALDAGVRLSLPVMAVGLAVQVALALVARASPSLQVFNVGMGVTVAAALLALLGTLDDASGGLAAELQRAGARIDHVLTRR